MSIITSLNSLIEIVYRMVSSICKCNPHIEYITLRKKLKDVLCIFPIEALHHIGKTSKIIPKEEIPYVE